MALRRRHANEVVSRNCATFDDDSHSDQVRQAACVRRVRDMGAVQFDGSEADAEVTGDDFIRLASCHLLENLALARRQCRGARLQCSAFEPLLERPIVSMQ